MSGQVLKSPKFPYTFSWSEITKWTQPIRIIRFDELPQGWRLLPISDFARKIEDKEEVKPETEYSMTGVRGNGGGLFVREQVLGKNQSANYLHPVVPGSLMYNRLFAWKGSFSVVSDEFSGCYVSNEFPQFWIDRSVALSEYLFLVAVSRNFIDAVASASIGSSAVSRNRFIESEFVQMKIPIPPLATQQKIVAYWEDAQAKIAEARSERDALIAELNRQMIGQTNKYSLVKQSKTFFAEFSQLEQWDLKAGRAAVFQQANPSFIRLGDYTEECSDIIKPWEIEDHIWPIYGVSNQEGVFLSKKQHSDDFNAPYKHIEKNWFFHNPTRANVGSLGKVPQVPDDALTSPEYQVWKLTGGYLPEFMDLLIQTDYFLTLVSFNRVGGVKQRMYYSNLAEIRLPSVSRSVQESFVNRKIEVEKKIASAGSEMIKVKRRVEQLILGALSVEDI